MRVSTLIMAAGVASVTEIRFYGGHPSDPKSRCSGAYVVCSDIDARTCCIHGTFNATQAEFLYTPVRAVMLAYQKNDTLPPCTTTNARGAATDAGIKQCSSYGPALGSARWYEYANKWWDMGKSKACTGTQTADVLVVDEGTTYSLKGMQEVMQKELFEHVGNGLGGRDIPAKFDEYKVFPREL